MVFQNDHNLLEYYPIRWLKLVIMNYKLSKKYFYNVLIILFWSIFWWLFGLKIYMADGLIGEKGCVWLIPSLYSFFIKALTVTILYSTILLFFNKKGNSKNFPLNVALSLVTIFKKISNKIEKCSIKRLAVILFISTLVIYLFFSFKLVHPYADKDRRIYLLTGDEPQYLLMTHSLVFDRDFNLYNNVGKGDSLLFFDRVVNGFSGGVELFGQYARGNKATASSEYWYNKRYPKLNLGLPVIIAPFYALGLLLDDQVRLCVMIFVNILAALFVVNIFLLSCNLVKSKFGSLLICSFTSLSMPVLFYSNQIYPDLPASLLLVYSFRKIYERDFNNLLIVLALGFFIGFVPWMHVKYILPSALLIIFFVFQWKIEKYRFFVLMLFLFTILISLILQTKYYYFLFGVPYPVNMHPGFYVKNLFKGLLGLFYDEGHGLIPYAPIYLISFVGAFLFLKKRELGFYSLFWLLAVPLTFILFIACFKEWWAGFCPAGRYLLVTIPFMAVFAAYAYNRITLPAFRGITIGLGVISVLTGVFGMFLPGRLYAHTHPIIPYLGIGRIFPNMFELNIQQYMLVLFWIILSVIFAVFYVVSIKKYHKYINNWIFGTSVLFIFLFFVNLLKIDYLKAITNMDKLKIYRLLNTDKYIPLFKETSKKYKLIDRGFMISKLAMDFEAEELLSEKENKVSDEGANNKIAVRGLKGITKEGYLLYGPYIKFPKGNYVASFRLKMDNNQSLKNIVILDIVSHCGKMIYCKREIKGTDFDKENEYQDFDIAFSVKHDAGDIEFRVFYAGECSIWIDKISISPLNK